MSAKRRYRLYLWYIVIGALFLIVSFAGILPESILHYTQNYGVVILLIGVLKASRFHGIVSDAQRTREYEARQKEERTDYITMRTAKLIFLGSVYVQLAASLVLSYLNHSVAAQVLVYLSALQGVAYYIIWRVLDRTY